MGRSFAQAGITIFGLILVLTLTLLIFGMPVLESLKLIASGALGDKFGITRTLVKTTPLVLCGTGLVIAWKGGMYNVGGEGQFVMGGLFAAITGELAISHGWPIGAVPVLLLISSIIGGTAWAAFAGWLYVRRGVEVVISTILLNFIAIQLLGWAINGPLQEPNHQYPQSRLLPDAAMLYHFDRQTDLHIGVFVALLVPLAGALFLKATVAGYRLRLVGESKTAARANGISAEKSQLLAMAISGALCGLAGGIEYAGMAGQLGGQFAQGWGFLGIPVALIANLDCLLVLPSALYFGGLLAGTRNLAGFTQNGTTLVYVIQSVAVLGLVGLRTWIQRSTSRREAFRASG